MNDDTCRPLCEVPGCDRPLGRSRMCWMHGLMMRADGVDRRIPLPPKPTVCRVEGCDKPIVCRVLCHAHYTRLRRDGDPGEAALRRAPDNTPADIAGAAALDRIGWDVTASGCWEWRGVRSTWNYGMVNGRSAHRIAYTRAHGSIPEGMFICHRCDNPPCVNPDHLFAGTPAENTADAIAKGRMARGEKAGPSRLTKATVLEIRARAAAGELQYRIAEDIGVCNMTISHIVRRKSWTHI